MDTPANSATKKSRLSLRGNLRREEHTPLTSPLPKSIANTQRGLFERRNKNESSPLVRGMREVRGERGVCALFVNT